jgi:ABC-type cobalamin/Fe3+-siderophores transport system ATPase subunit
MSPQSPFMRLQAFWQEFAEDDRVLDVIAASENPADGDEVVLREPRAVPDDITSLAMARMRSAERTDIPSMVPLEHLSDGQRAVLRFASVLLFSDRPLDLLLIDEPERNLHPRWHHRLLPSLRALAPDTQILVATHSPDVVASVQSYERFSFGDESRFGVAVPDAAE